MSNELRKLAQTLKPDNPILRKSEAQIIIEEARKQLLQKRRSVLKILKRRIILENLGENKKRFTIRDPEGNIIVNLNLIRIGNRTHLYNLWTGSPDKESAFRNLGLAKTVIEYAKRVARTMPNVKWVTLTCTTDKIPFYEKFGFKVYESYDEDTVNMQFIFDK